MNWRNHRITTIAIIYAATGSFTATSLSLIGAVLPDKLEVPSSERNRLWGIIPYGEPKRTTLIAHRTWTHWPWSYCLLALTAWIMFSSSRGWLAYISYALLFVMSGAVCHLFADSLSKGGIPLVAPRGKKRGVGFYVLGTPSEHYTALGITLFAGVIALFKGYFSKEYLAYEVDLVLKLVFGLFRRG